MADLRTTQQFVRVLADAVSPLRVTQQIVRVLGTRNPCTPTTCPPWMKEGLARRMHRFARLIQIEREDGQDFHFTDHNGQLTYSDGQVYTPIGGGNLSASEHESGEREHTAEMEGAIIVGGADLSDFEAGLFDNARITIRVVDWRYPWADCYWKWRGYMRNVQFDGMRWIGQLGGISSKFQRARGAVYSRDCTRDLGDAFDTPDAVGCHYDEEGTEESSTVIAVLSEKRTFTCAATAGHPSEYFVAGRLFWDTGDNAPILSIVKRAEEVSSGVYEIEVEMSLPNAIQVGDDLRLRQGCQKRFAEDCTPKGQTADFNGFRFMPGEDGLQVNPNEPGG